MLENEDAALLDELTTVETSTESSVAETDVCLAGAQLGGADFAFPPLENSIAAEPRPSKNQRSDLLFRNLDVSMRASIANLVYARVCKREREREKTRRKRAPYA